MTSETTPVYKPTIETGILIHSV